MSGAMDNVGPINGAEAINAQNTKTNTAKTEGNEQFPNSVIAEGSTPKEAGEVTVNEILGFALTPNPENAKKVGQKIADKIPDGVKERVKDFIEMSTTVNPEKAKELGQKIADNIPDGVKKGIKKGTKYGLIASAPSALDAGKELADKIPEGVKDVAKNVIEFTTLSGSTVAGKAGTAFREGLEDVVRTNGGPGGFLGYNMTDIDAQIEDIKINNNK